MGLKLLAQRGAETETFIDPKAGTLYRYRSMVVERETGVANVRRLLPVE